MADAWEELASLANMRHPVQNRLTANERRVLERARDQWATERANTPAKEPKA